MTILLVRVPYNVFCKQPVKSSWTARVTVTMKMFKLSVSRLLTIPCFQVPDFRAMVIIIKTLLIDDNLKIFHKKL